MELEAAPTELDTAFTTGRKLDLLDSGDYNLYAHYLRLARAIFPNPQRAQSHIAPLLAHHQSAS